MGFMGEILRNHKKSTGPKGGVWVQGVLPDEKELWEESSHLKSVSFPFTDWSLPNKTQAGAPAHYLVIILSFFLFCNYIMVYTEGESPQ